MAIEQSHEDNTSTENNVGYMEEGDDDYSPEQHNVPTPSVSTPSNHYSGLTEAQQNKFIDYLDDRLLKISRRFVKRASEEDDGTAYQSLIPLLEDLNQLIDVIWYSISGADHSQLFGQNYYLLRIADELVDFIGGYYQDPKPKETIEVLKKMDTIFAKMIDEGKMKQTEAVRLESIAERTRIIVAKVLDGLQNYDNEVSKVYDQVLDRTS